MVMVGGVGRKTKLEETRILCTASAGTVRVVLVIAFLFAFRKSQK